MKGKNILRSIWQIIYRVFLVLLYLFPIAMLIWVAFKSAKDIAINILGIPSEWIGFENFSTAIEKMEFLKYGHKTLSTILFLRRNMVVYKMPKPSKIQHILLLFL